MLSSWTRFLLAATPENALGASAVVHVAALAVMAVWMVGRIAEPPRFGSSAPGLQLVMITDEPDPEPPAVRIKVDFRPASPPDPEVTDPPVQPARPVPPRRKDPLEPNDDLLRDPELMPPPIARQEAVTADTWQAQREPPAPLMVRRRIASRPRTPVPLVSNEKTPPTFAPGMPLIYPEEARRRGWQGVVHLRLYISAAGRVTRAEVIRSSGYAVLDDAAVRSVLKWEGQPAYRSGQPVSTVEVLPVRFRLR